MLRDTTAYVLVILIYVHTYINVRILEFAVIGCLRIRRKDILHKDKNLKC